MNRVTQLREHEIMPHPTRSPASATSAVPSVDSPVTQSASQALLPASLREIPNGIRWLQFVLRQSWEKGNLDKAVWRVSLRAAHFRIPASLVFEVVSRFIVAAGDPVPAEKTRSQIQRAREHVASGRQTSQSRVARPSAPGGNHKRSPRRRVSFEPEKLAAVVSENRSLVGDDPEDFITARSLRPPDVLNSADVLGQLYRPGERVLVFTEFRSQGQHVFVAGGQVSPPLPIGGADGVLFLINPIDGNYYPNPRQANKLSRRSEEAITAWRYALIESDEADLLSWLTFLAVLPMPIVAIYQSGGKSIHALVRVEARSKKDWDERVAHVKPALVELGADAAALTAVRLSRLPQAWRGDRCQRLIYLNPKATAVPISALPLRGAKSGPAGEVAK